MRCGISKWTEQEAETDNPSDGIITLPIALFGFFYFPDIPENTTATYLNESERKMAVTRLPPLKEGGHSISPISLMKRLFLQPLL